MPANDVLINIEARDKTEQVFHKVGNSLNCLRNKRVMLVKRRVQLQPRWDLWGMKPTKARSVSPISDAPFSEPLQRRKNSEACFKTRADGSMKPTVNTRKPMKPLRNSVALSSEQATCQRLDRGFTKASGGANILTRSVSSLGGVLGALGIAAVTHEIGRAGITSIQTAGRLDQLQRALTNIEGSSQSAQVRFEALVEIANRPGLQLEQLVHIFKQTSAAGLAAEDVDKILLTVGETVVSLGGSAATSALAMEQIIQAIQLGQVDFRDFRTIVQQIPGYLEALGDVHGVEANIDGLHEALLKSAATCATC